MDVPNYLILRSDANPPVECELLSHSDGAFGGLRRPPHALAQWIESDAFPAAAQRVLDAEGSLRELEGLSRVLVQSETRTDYEAGWILARSRAGLVSILVRDARDFTVASFDADASFVLKQAERYFAFQSLVLVQANSGSDLARARAVMEAVLQLRDVAPDTLYEKHDSAGGALGVALLSA
jgi:hypothetical protein